MSTPFLTTYAPQPKKRKGTRVGRLNRQDRETIDQALERVKTMPWYCEGLRLEVSYRHWEFWED